MVQTRKTKDAPSLSFERLTQALAADVPGRERAWAEAVIDALTAVEQVMRQQLAAAEALEGPLAQVDQTRPSLVRQSEEVCRNQSDLLGQVIALRQEAQKAVQAFSSTGDPQNSAYTLTARPNTIPDFGVIRRQAEEFLTRVQQNREVESKLVLESINTDIGAGD
jgi:hypothetical protein